MTGNGSQGPCLANIYGPPDSFQIDIATENGRVKCFRPISEFHDLSEAVIAQGTEGNLLDQLLLEKSKVGNDYQDHEYTSTLTHQEDILLTSATDPVSSR